MKSLVIPLVVLASLVANVAQAAKLIAVLPLDVTHTEGKLSPSAQASIEEMLRDLAANELGAQGWTVLSGENTLQVIADNGRQPEDCGQSNCHLGLARELNAEKFISGSVQHVDGLFTASIRLIDTATGRILASELVEGKNVTGLRGAFKEVTARFFAKAGLQGGSSPPDVQPNGPRVKRSAVAAVVGTLTISVKPKEGARLDLVDPDGQKSSSGASYDNKQAKVGRWKVTARAAGYEEQTLEVEVPGDDVAFQKVELKPLGALKITGTPAGAAVSVKGPGGFHDDGGLPWEADGLKSGPYQVKVSREGYGTDEQTAEVKPGETTAVAIKLMKGAGMANIPAGTFTMSSNKGFVDKPEHPVTVAAFALDRTEVTVGAYLACVNAGQCSAERVDMCGKWGNWGVPGRANHPMNCVDWHQAKAYCVAQGARLPTEAEWEYAARGNKDDRWYPWGDDWPSKKRAQFAWDFESLGTAPVGTHPAGASPFGIQDMSGNVLEWVEDPYVTYDTKKEMPDTRVLRGGSFHHSKEDSALHSLSRGRRNPGTRDADLGFRCARDGK